jgi:hypothetical protein
MTTKLRSFTALLAAAEDGVLTSDLDNELHKLVQEMRDHAATTNGRAAGKLALTLEFKIEGEVVELRADIKTTAPKPVRGKSVMWSTIDGDLTRSNPKQPDMFRDVSADRSEVRNV